MMPAAHNQTVSRKTYDFILFRLGSFLFGVEANQVIRISRRKMPDRNPNIPDVNLRDIFQLTSHNQTDTPGAVLEIETHSSRTHILVDAAEGAISLSLDQIKELPPLVERHKSHAALWGTAFVDEKIVFLVDLDLLEPEKAV